jgi:hypothetical protein
MRDSNKRNDLTEGAVAGEILQNGRNRQLDPIPPSSVEPHASVVVYRQAMAKKNLTRGNQIRTWTTFHLNVDSCNWEYSDGIYHIFF